MDQNYAAWAEMLFAKPDPPTLREETFLLVGSWYEGDTGPDGQHCSLEEAEAQAINLALSEFEDVVLNVAGETWWAPAASTRVKKHSSSRPNNPVHLVKTVEQLTGAVVSLARADVIGLDVETTLYSQKLCLVQCVTRTETFVIDAIALRDISPLRTVLGAGSVKVIHNSLFERRIFLEHGIKVEPVFDTPRASRAHGAKSGGHRLADVVMRHLGREMDKSQQTSDWSRRPLTDAQIEYGALDAEVLVPLYVALAPPLLAESTWHRPR